MANGGYSDFVYPLPRPDLTVESTGGAKLGNCFHASYFKITSRHRMTSDTIHALRKAGFLGFGQGFYLRSQHDGKEAPTLSVESPCVEKDRHTGKVISENAINPYSGKPYGSTTYKYYVYECEDQCDSGD